MARGVSGVPAALAFVVVAAAAACDAGDPAQPPGPVLAAPVQVGPSPLRRLSDGEYLNALHDLFPALSLTLPALPPDVPVAGFDNAASAQAPSDVLIARYEAIANLYAAAATVDTPSVISVTGCADWSTRALATSCASRFVSKMGWRLFRRPLDGGEQGRFLASFESWTAAVDFPG